MENTPSIGRSDMRIMFVGDNFKYYTGFSYVLVSLLKRYMKESLNGNNVCYVSMTNGKPEHKDLEQYEPGLAENLRNMRIYDSNIEKEDTIINFNLAVTEFQPHVVITLNDPWRLAMIARSPFRDSFFWAAYTTIETPEYPRTLIMPTVITNQPRMNIHEILGNADIIIPYTKMGEKHLLTWYDRSKVSEPIYSGVDLEKTEGIITTRAEAYDAIIPEDAFVFFSMGTNSPRKQMDRVVDAFYKFKTSMKGNTDKYYLAMHTGSNMILNGADLAEQIYKYGLQTSVYLSCTDSLMPSDQIQLQKEYAACDCYIGLPGGEGFGYGFAEAIAHKKPVIYINYGGHAEYCKGCGIAVDTAGTYRVRNSNIEWANPDIDAAAAAMRKIVSDKKIYTNAVAGSTARREDFRWDTLFERFRKTIEDKYKSKEHAGLYGMARRKVQ